MEAVPSSDSRIQAEKRRALSAITLIMYSAIWTKVIELTKHASSHPNFPETSDSVDILASPASDGGPLPQEDPLDESSELRSGIQHWQRLYPRYPWGRPGMQGGIRCRFNISRCSYTGPSMFNNVPFYHYIWDPFVKYIAMLLWAPIEYCAQENLTISFLELVLDFEATDKLV